MSITRRIREVVRSNLNALLDRAAQLGGPVQGLDSYSEEELERALAERRASRRSTEQSFRAREALDDARREREEREQDSKRQRDTLVDEAAREAEARKRENEAYRTQKVNEHQGAEHERQKDREARIAAEAARKRELDELAARARLEADALRRESERRREQAVREAAEKARIEELKRAAEQRARDDQEQRKRAEARARAAHDQARPQRGSLRADPKLAQYYALLELPYGASYDEVKAAYRRLMRKYHPDLYSADAEKLRLSTQLSQSLTQAHNELELVLVGGPNRGSR